MREFPDIEEQLGVEWLKVILQTENVSTTLPSVQDHLAQLRAGYCVVIKVGDALPDRYVRRPIYQVECHVAPSAAHPSQPPWGQASGIATAIADAIRYQSRRSQSTDFDIPDYGLIRVLPAGLAVTPRRVLGDQGGNATYTLDIYLPWRRNP